MTAKTSGTCANDNGQLMEKQIEMILLHHKYAEIPKYRFRAARYLRQPIFSKQFHLGQSIYGTDLFCDFILYHPAKFPDCLIIESKWQQSSGSVDEKFPFLVDNLKQPYCPPSVIVLDGGGYKPQAEAWLRSQTDAKLLHVFCMKDFQKWANSGNI